MGTPILNWPVAAANEAPANHAAHMQALADTAETFTVMRFADAADRDVKIPTPIQGMECWLDNPGEYQYFDTAWQRRHKPIQGGQPYYFSAVPTADVQGWQPADFTQFDPPVFWPVPDWAKTNSSFFCKVTIHTRLDAGGGNFAWRIAHSVNGGGAWTNHMIVPLEGSNSFISFMVPITNARNTGPTIDIPNGTTEIMTRAEFKKNSGPGGIDRITGDTVLMWEVTFFADSSIQPTSPA